MDKKDHLEQKPKRETETPPHGDPLAEAVERIAETNLPKTNDANEVNREDSRPGTNT